MDEAKEDILACSVNELKDAGKYILKKKLYYFGTKAK